jgi:hypothetical protein
MTMMTSSNNPVLTLRSSSLDRIKLCAGYASLSQRGSTENVNTKTGTLVHAYLEKCINAGKVLNADEADWESDSKKILGEDPEPEDAYVNAVSFANWFFKEYSSISQANNYSKVGKELEVYCEQEMSLDFPGLNAKLSGHCDVVIVYPDSVAVVDWKYYRSLDWLPPVEENSQLQAYAVMAAKKFGKKRAKVCIASVRHCETFWDTFSPQKLLIVESKINNIIEEAAKNYGKYTVGPHCDSCFASRSCPEYLDHSAFLARGFQWWDGSAPKNNEEALYLLRAQKAAEVRIDSAKAAITQYVEDEGLIIDYSSRKKYSKGKWSKKEIYKGKKGKTLTLLKDYLGKDCAKEAISVTLSGIKRAIKASTFPEELYRDLLEKLEEEGLVEEKSFNSVRWRKL